MVMVHEHSLHLGVQVTYVLFAAIVNVVANQCAISTHVGEQVADAAAAVARCNSRSAPRTSRRHVLTRDRHVGGRVTHRQWLVAAAV